MLTNIEEAKGADAPASSAASPRMALKSARHALTVLAIAFVVVMTPWTPANATKPINGQCMKKYNSCLANCDAKWIGLEFRRSCYSRCFVSLGKCDILTSRPSKNEQTPPAAHQPRPDQASGPYISGAKNEPVFRPATDNSGPLGTGILDNGPTFHGQGPSATGSPAGGGMPKAPPAAPPVILR